MGLNVNLRVGVFATTASIVLALIAADRMPTPNDVVQGRGQIIEFKTQFDQSSTEKTVKLVEKFNRNGSGRILIKLQSPGGEVFSGRLLQSKLKEPGLPIDTYVGGMAASMAADTFMIGDRRYVDEDAMILFHGAHGGSYVLSEEVLGKVLSILKAEHDVPAPIPAPQEDTASSVPVIVRGAIQKPRPKHIPNPNASPEERDLGGVMDAVREMVAEVGYTVAIHDLTTQYEMLKMIDHTMAERISEKLIKENPKWTVQRVESELFGNFKKDMIFTGKQLKEMGVATALGAPSEKDYAG